MLASALFLLAGAALAHNSDHLRTSSVDILYPSQIANGPELQPGTYKVELASTGTPSKVMFYRYGKLVAEVPAKLVSEPTKNAQSEIYYNQAGNEHFITQIDVRGWNNKLLFRHSDNNQAKS
jgi:hypothetical protein